LGDLGWIGIFLGPPLIKRQKKTSKNKIDPLKTFIKKKNLKIWFFNILAQRSSLSAILHQQCSKVSLHTP
jgi:hypothetical protein